MSLNEAVQAKLAEWRPEGEGRQSLVIPDEASGWAVNISADRQDVVGCLLWEVTLRRAQPFDGDVEKLRSRATAIAERVTGLMDPLKVVEVDAPRCEALLRSENPVRRGDAVLYHELLLKGSGEALLRRYQGAWEADKRRGQIPFALTHEAIAKTAADIATDE